VTRSQNAEGAQEAVSGDKKSRKEIGEKEIYLCKKLYCSQDVTAGRPCTLLQTWKSRVSRGVYDQEEAPRGGKGNQQYHGRRFLSKTSARRGCSSDAAGT
jgi:hypothetical protein